MAAIGIAAYLAILAVLAAGTVARPYVAIAAVICMFALDQLGQVSHPFLLTHSAFTNYAVAGAVFVALLRRRVGLVEFLGSATAETWLVFSLFIYAFVSITWTPVPEAALSQWGAAWPYLLTVIVFSPLLVTGARELRSALKWLMFVGGALASVLLFFVDWGPRGLMVPSLGYDGQTNPLALASVAAYTASAALFIDLGSRKVWSWTAKIFIVVVCVFLILRTGSRGQLVALLAAIVLMFPIRFRFNNIRNFLPLMISIGLVVAAVDIGSSLYIAAEEARWSDESATADAEGRLQMAGALLNAWSGSYVSILFGLGNSASFDPDIVGYYPHVMPLEILGEEGLFGFALFIGLIVLTIKRFRQAAKIVKARAGNADIVAVTGSFVVISFLLSLKQGNLLANNLLFMTVLILARAAMAVATSAEAAPRINGPSSRKSPANLMR